MLLFLSFPCCFCCWLDGVGWRALVVPLLERVIRVFMSAVHTTGNALEQEESSQTLAQHPWLALEKSRRASFEASFQIVPIDKSQTRGRHFI